MPRFSKENWPHLSPLLDEALELAPEARAAWLERHRVSHPSLAVELEALLGSEDELEREGFLSPAEAPVIPLVSTLVGQRLGAYVLERPIGQGGMGSVWLARRSDGRFEGAVAIKFLSLAVAGPAGEARFRREGSVLARLTHPNIARLLDAGVSPEGQPYLVLEHVDGLPIDQWCDQRRLPVEARLKLFLQVLDAVAHAHSNLIVHRDLKPANILVTPDGTVKLLDFGIAKLLEDGAGARSVLTGSHEAVLTFEYAAPEQIQGDPISTATDVYCLGVLLYELLAGQHPTSKGCVTPAEHVRAILETDPGVLSRVVGPSGTRSSEEAIRLAAARDASPDRLRRWYTGDLDNILSKALRKNPSDRYPTVTAFGDDLSRYLGHEPVLARPDAWTYRAAKFIRRHRGSVSSAVLVAILLVAAAVLTTLQARQARKQRDVAVLQLKRSRAIAAVERVLAGDSRGADGRQLSPAERIGLATTVLERQFKQEPWLVAEVMADLASPFYESGDRLTERSILLKAQEVARASGSDMQVALASCHRVHSFAYDNLLDSAHADLAEAKAAMARTRDLPAEVDALCLDAEASLLMEEGHPDSAVPLMARAVARVQADTSTGPLDATYLGSLLNDYASALRGSGRTREASRYQIQLVASLDTAGYADTDILPNAVSFLTGALNELGEFAVEDSILLGFVRRQERRDGPGHTTSMLGFLHGLAQLRIGVIDSADLWITRSLSDTSASSVWTASWAPPALAELRLLQHRPADARAPLKLISTDTTGSRAFRFYHISALLRSELSDRAGAAALLEGAIDGLTKPGVTVVPRLAPLLLTAAQWRLAKGDGMIADSLARRAVIAAAVDSLSLTRNGVVGQGELLSARALLLRQDLPAARAAAGRAVVALGNGLGPDSPWT
ncbi:MAG: serine/threonine-protein kinase, partial [Gemmatimonadota bacterium]